jgi:hypothetical protein
MRRHHNVFEYRPQAPGVSFADLLALLFIGLRLGGAIDWPWVWVLSPLWIPLALGLFVVALGGLVALAIVSRKAKPGQPSSAT